MGRMIDADKLVKAIWEKHKETEEMFDLCADELKDLYCDIVAMVDAQPTAYDTDKVVKEIKDKKCQKCRNILGAAGAEKYCKDMKCEIEEICEIVRKGGVDGKIN